ncbi:MAG: hypothetical protein NDJ89_01360 [Oligoflexia bacterium]|nr:hypothetical protein [Oligoflexia bacterium]
MEPLYLQSEKALYSYLKKFLKEKPNAVQLDGSTTATPNRGVVVVFRYSVTGQKYKLLGELTRKAAQEFVKLVDEHGEAGVALREYESEQGECLILANSREPGGWACVPYVNKSSDKFKRAA